MIDQQLVARMETDPLSAVIDYYAERLPHSPYAIAFLTRRHLAASSELRVGFADRTLGTKLPAKRLKAGHRVRSQLTELGVLRGNGRELFRGLVTVPLTGRSGKSVTGIYGLRVDPSQGEKEATIGKGIFNAEALSRFSEIILCQSVLDAWTFCGCGYQNVVAVSGITPSSELFKAVDRVLVTGDVDASLLGGKELLQITLPAGMAVTDYVLVNKTLADPLGPAVRAAKWISGAPPERVSEDRSVEQVSTESQTTEQSVIQVEATEEEAVAEEECNTSGPTQPAVPDTSPVPQPSHDELPVEHNEHETVITIENRRWRIRGLERNTTTGVMRVNVALFNAHTDRFHIDQLDLYHARSRRSFLTEAAEETALGEYDLRSDLARVLMKLEQLQHEQQTDSKAVQDNTASMSDAERSEAMSLLTNERLIDRILEDFERCGIVGERIGNLASYLVATSRLLSKPLGLVIQSSSSAGKSSLIDAALAFMPSEQLLRCTAMTSRSLYYAGNLNLQHKILAISEEEGIRHASYALKLLQSEGELSIVSTTKENGTGRTVVEQHQVRGPVAMMMTTTTSDIDPELLNRCLVLSVDEDTVQTELIQQQQREEETIDALVRQRHREQIRKVHQHAQRLLRPIQVINPYAGQLKFTSRAVRNRRDHLKYLSLIRVVTLLHQHQRETKTETIAGERIEYLEVTREDIAVGNMIADAVLGTSIDELPPQSRRLLRELFHLVGAQAESTGLRASEIRFTRRQLRESLGWSTTQLRYHLQRLCDHEYVVPDGYAGRGRLTHYQLLFDGRGYEGQRAICHLADPKQLIDPTTDEMSG